MFNNSCIVSLNTTKSPWYTLTYEAFPRMPRMANKGYCDLGDLIMANKQSKQTTSLRELNVQKHNI